MRIFKDTYIYKKNDKTEVKYEPHVNKDESKEEVQEKEQDINYGHDYDL